jgi:K+-sensing histidine kinase KdpD
MSDLPNRVRPLGRLRLVPVDDYRRYGLALGAVALALLAALSLQRLWQQPPSLLFTAAVILTSLYGGLRAGVVASVLSIAALDFFFLRALFSLQMELVDSVDFILFLGVTWLVVSLQSLRQAQDHGRHAPQSDDMTVVVVKVRPSTAQDAGHAVSNS